MGRSASLGLFCATALLTAACSAKAQVAMPDNAPLAVPPAPVRLIVPAAPDAPRVPVPDLTPTSTTPTTPTNTARPRAEAPPVRPTPPPATPPAASPAMPPVPVAPTPLEATPNPNEFERKARDLVTSANALLEKIDYKGLGADGRVQYDTAKRFLQQADAAIKVKNLVYAWQLADKANTIATLLK